MDDKTFSAFLALLMCCDPWPVQLNGDDNRSIVESFVDKAAQKRGYTGWLDAYRLTSPGYVDRDLEDVLSAGDTEVR